MDKIKKCIDFLRRTYIQYKKEFKSSTYNEWNLWGASESPVSIVNHKFYIKHYPITGEFFPIVHVETSKHIPKDSPIRTSQKWNGVESTSSTKFYIISLLPILNRKIVKVTRVQRYSDIEIYNKFEMGLSPEISPCKTKKEALSLIRMYKEQFMESNVVEELITI